MELATIVQILDQTIYISLCINVLDKGMNPFILSSSYEQIVWQTGFFCLDKATIQEGNL